ncbi:melibiose:sodium transporter MelB [Endozoicomonas sp. Mp262]|uniref:melibiose:sodium transporter MelB n=1 Tax=Endozoicomonas sp. Mp262 TaxID=2919499 RepID=UPI0021DA0262
MSSEQAHKVSLTTKLSYGFGGFGKDFGLAVINTFLFFYYTDIVGVSAAFIGTVFLFARIWDTVNDPMLGYIVSKTRSRWGKYKPWILVGNILNALFIVALFSAHNFSGSQQLVFIAITYIGWGMTYTLLDAPFWSMIPTITLDKWERERLMPYPRLCASLGGYLASGTGIMAVKFLGGGDDGQGYMLFALIAAGLAVISAVVTCIWTKESFEVSEETTAAFNLKDAMKLIFKNDQFVILLVLALLFNIAVNMTSGLNLYFYAYVLGDNNLFSTYMLWAGIFGVGSLLVFTRLIDIFGRRTVFSASIIMPVVSAGVLYIAANFAPDSKVLIAISGIAFGLSNALYWLMVLLMVADTVDYGDYKLGIRAESISYSTHTLVIKCTGALTGFLVGISLTIIDYVPNQVQTAETILGLQAVYIAPSLLCLVSYLIYRKFYRLNGGELDKVQEQLEEKYSVAAAV